MNMFKQIIFFLIIVFKSLTVIHQNFLKTISNYSIFKIFKNIAL